MKKIVQIIRMKMIDLTQQTFLLMKTSWRRLDEVFLLRLQKTSWRRVQDVLVKTNIFVLAIRLQDVVKTFSRRLSKTSSRHLQDVFKTFQDVFTTSSRHLGKRLQDIFKTSCKDIFKTFSRRIIQLSCSC